MVAASGDPVNAPTIGKGKVLPMTIKRRLHVWEHPSMHSKEGNKDNKPVHVVFDDHEFDWWEIGPQGLLRVGIREEHLAPDGITVYIDNIQFYALSAGMYAKAWLEEYEDEPAPELEPATETPLFNIEDKPVGSGTGATDPVLAREILMKQMADEDERVRREATEAYKEQLAKEYAESSGNDSLLGLDQPAGDNTPTGLIFPLPPREFPPVVLKDGMAIKVTPPALDETRLDLTVPLDVKSEKTNTDNAEKE